MAQPQAYQQVAITTQTGKGALEPMSILLNDSFRDDPAMRYGLGALSEAEQEAYRQQFLRVLFKAAALNGGSFHFARDDKSCGGIWVPPGKKIDNPLTVFPAGFLGVIRKLGLKGSSRILLDLPSQSNDRKKHHLYPVSKRYHYLFFLGTATSAQGQGLGGAIIKRVQDRILASSPHNQSSKPSLPAGETPLEFLPIWLESSTEGSRRLYERCGFRQVGENIILGGGTHDRTGRPVPKEQAGTGDGVFIYPMIWIPEGFQVANATTPAPVADAAKAPVTAAEATPTPAVAADATPASAPAASAAAPSPLPVASS